MDAENTTNSEPIVNVTDLRFALIYATNFDETKKFYEKYFGFKDQMEMPDSNIGPQAFGTIGDVHMWIGGGHDETVRTVTGSRAGVMFGVDSVFKLFGELNHDGITMHMDEPIEMQEDVYWLVFDDPSGNSIEVLGPK